MSFVFERNFRYGAVVNLALLRLFSWNHFQCICAAKARVLRPRHPPADQRSVAVVFLFEFDLEYGVSSMLQEIDDFGSIRHDILVELVRRVGFAFHDILRYPQRLAVLVDDGHVAIVVDLLDGVIHGSREKISFFQVRCLALFSSIIIHVLC